jgi:hypothetical protein
MSQQRFRYATSFGGKENGSSSGRKEGGNGDGEESIFLMPCVRFEREYGCGSRTLTSDVEAEMKFWGTDHERNQTFVSLNERTIG